jgi:hypothetical protein
MRTQSVANLAEVDPEISITLESKKHEDLATMVEYQLREHFGRQDIWVLPEQQNNPPHGHYPCVRVIDGNSLEAEFNSAVHIKAKEIVPVIYGQEDVYVSVEDVTVMPEGDALKYVIDHLLSLQFGHRDYFTEFFRIEGTNLVEIVINDMNNFGIFDEDEETGEIEYTGKDVAEMTAKGYAYPIPMK